MRRIAFAISLLIISAVYAASPAPVRAKHAMVVTAHALATKVGIDILRRGGNAVDAAVAVGYALNVVRPCCGGMGGGGFMLVHLANGENALINFREKAPNAVSPKDYLDQHGNVLAARMQSGYLGVAVPGFVMGMENAWKRYGSLPWDELIAPAITLAEKGFRLTWSDTDLLDTSIDYFKKDREAARLFLSEGKPLVAGQCFVQDDLANTLKNVAKNGSAAFYKGEIATKISNASRNRSGLLTVSDFSKYTAPFMHPVQCHYRGYDIVTAGPPSSGGVTLCEILNIVAGYPLSRLGYGSAAAFHYNIEAMRFAYADRNRYLGDPDFVNNPVRWLLSPAHTDEIRTHILPHQATPSNVIKFDIKNKNKSLIHQTTHASIVDEKGNAVAMTLTLNHYFGAKVIAPGTGFFLNNEMGDFAVKRGAPNTSGGLVYSGANVLAPNKRPLSSMSPTMLFKDGKLKEVIGTPGGPTIITQLVEAIENQIDYGMDVQAAEDAPRYHMQWYPDTVFYERFSFSPDTQVILNGMGYLLREGISKEYQRWGKMTAVARDDERKVWLGASDSRNAHGLALGY